LILYSVLGEMTPLGNSRLGGLLSKEGGLI